MPSSAHQSPLQDKEAEETSGYLPGLFTKDSFTGIWIKIKAKEKDGKAREAS